MKLGSYKVFACPKCRRKFTKLRSLNTHLTRSHAAKFKLEYIGEAKPLKIRTKRPVSKNRDFMY